MKYIICILALFSHFITYAITCEKENLKIGYFNYPPFSYQNPKIQNDASGLWVETTKESLKSLNCKNFEFILLPLTRIMYYLEKGDIDIAIVVAKNPDREKIAYYKRHFGKANHVLLVSQENYSQLNNLNFDELISKTKKSIGYIRGGYIGDIFEKKRLKYPDKFEAGKDLENLIVRLYKKRLIATAFEFFAAELILNKLKQQSIVDKEFQINFLDIKLDTKTHYGYNAYSKKSMTEKFAEEIDDKILELYKNGFIKKTSTNMGISDKIYKMYLHEPKFEE